MNSSIVSKTETEVTLKVDLDEAQLKAVQQSVLETLRGRVKVAGFRPGKAPDQIVEREVGSHAIQHEVLETAVQRSYGRAVKEHELAPVGSPDVSIDKFVPFTQLEYRATLTILPPVDVPDWRQLKIKQPTVLVEDSHVDEVLEDLRRRLTEQSKDQDSDQTSKKESALPPLDDQLAARAGYQTLLEMKADIRRSLEVHRRQEAKYQFEQEVVRQLTDRAQFPVPERLTKHQAEHLEEDLQQRLSQDGLTLDEYAKRQNQTTSELEQTLRREAARRIKSTLLLREIARQEGIKISDAEVDTEIARLKESYSDPQVRKHLDEPGIKQDLVLQLLAEKTVSTIVKHLSGEQK